MTGGSRNPGQVARGASPGGHPEAGTLHVEIESLDIALNAVEPARCLRVASEPRLPPLSLPVEVTEAAGDVGLRSIEAPALRGGEVIKFFRCCGVAHAPAGKLGLLLPPLPPR